MFEVNLQEADLNYKRKQKVIVAKKANVMFGQV